MRRHFWALAARTYGNRSCPRKTFLNWTIPALVNNSVGSFSGTRDELFTTVWPCLAKNSKNDLRISFPVSIVIRLLLHSVADRKLLCRYSPGAAKSRRRVGQF